MSSKAVEFAVHRWAPTWWEATGIPELVELAKVARKTDPANTVAVATVFADARRVAREAWYKLRATLSTSRPQDVFDQGHAAVSRFATIDGTCMEIGMAIYAEGPDKLWALWGEVQKSVAFAVQIVCLSQGEQATEFVNDTALHEIQRLTDYVDVAWAETRA